MKKLLLIVLSSILLTSCTPKQTYPVKQMEFMLNTFCTITIYNEENEDKTAEELITEAFELCGDYEDLFSRTIE